MSFDGTFGLRVLANGTELFTTDPVPFTAPWDGLPRPSIGTILLSPDLVTAFVNTPGGPLPVAESFNRTLEVVPEPTSLTIGLLFGIIAITGACRRRTS
jgi:hypothetical protein